MLNWIGERFLNGYYGYANAGDEAVLAAILQHLGAQFSADDAASTCSANFIVTSGDPAQTQREHDAPAHPVRAIGRQNPRELLQQIRACDLFVSGGGSLVQDVTSLRNVIYYTGIMRMARWARKPLMIYAQGVGPLNQSLSRKLARAAFNGASCLCVRDAASAQLLRHIGVRREIHVTADPVWALDAPKLAPLAEKTWTLALRSWPENNGGSTNGGSTDGGSNDGGSGAFLSELAKKQGARLRLLPLQPQHDGPILRKYLQEHGDAARDEFVDTTAMPVRQIVGEAGRGDLMIAMRLHALIFAAAQGVPCIAINYDPKVRALAEIIGAPCLDSLNDAAEMENAIADAKPLSGQKRQELADLARSTAKLARALVKS